MLNLERDLSTGPKLKRRYTAVAGFRASTKQRGKTRASSLVFFHVLGIWHICGPPVLPLEQVRLLRWVNEAKSRSTRWILELVRSGLSSERPRPCRLEHFAARLASTKHLVLCFLSASVPHEHLFGCNRQRTPPPWSPVMLLLLSRIVVDINHPTLKYLIPPVIS